MLHTLVRGWYFEPDPTAGRYEGIGGVFPLDPWPVVTDDPTWIATGRRGFDLAATRWDDLPADWQERFVELASDAAGGVVRAAEAGRTPVELVADDGFLGALGRQLRRPWLDPPRVIALAGGVIATGEAGAVMAHAVINAYGRRLAGMPSSFATVPGQLPSELPDPSTMIKVGGPNPTDRKYVGFTVFGDRLSETHLDEITALIGRAADVRQVRGGLNLNRHTGRQYRVRQTGRWGISSQDDVLQEGPTLDDHFVWLLNILEPHAAALRRLMDELDLTAQFSCFYSQTRFNAEWVLEPRTLSRVVELGASIWYDSYADREDEDDDPS